MTEVYLVGGAVRDQLLGLAIKDKDFMVVGSDVDTMKSLGFMQVGADFPVFLHPKTHAEYALARIERKLGAGHTAFGVYAAPTVSAKEDLLRRDLTINALAIQVTGLFDDTPINDSIVDYYGGLQDLKDKILRHVSPAFSEDPLRVLRVARFFARFAPLGFRIHHDTEQLMQAIAESGELSTLSRERIWSETIRALAQPQGHLYFQCLSELNILQYIFPHLATLWKDEQCYQHTLKVLAKACCDDVDVYIRLSLVMAGFGEYNQAVKDSLKAINAPKQYAQLIQAYLTHHNHVCDFDKISAESLLQIIEQTKAHKDILTLNQLLLISQYWYQNTQAHTQYIKNILNQAVQCYHSISIADIDKTLQGKAIGEALTKKRHQKISQLLNINSQKFQEVTS